LGLVYTGFEITIRNMKVFFLSVCLTPFLFAQAPRGWIKTELPKIMENQVEFVGAWKDQDGKFNVRITKYRDQPLIGKIMGLKQSDNDTEPDLSLFPIEVKSIPAPHLGLWFRLGLSQKHEGFRHEYFWLRTQDAVVLMFVVSKGNAGFQLEEWKYGKIHSDKKGSLRAQFRKTAKELTPLLKSPPVIDLDTPLKAPIRGKADIKGPHIIVTIHDNGKFSINGKVQNEEQLLFAMRKASESNPDTILHIHGDMTTEFRFARKVIRLGATAGLNKVAFGTLKKGLTN